MKNSVVTQMMCSQFGYKHEDVTTQFIAVVSGEWEFKVIHSREDEYRVHTVKIKVDDVNTVLHRPAKLVNGLIPAKTECPYKNRCGLGRNHQCQHKGLEHHEPYSCGAARAFAS